MGPDHAFAREMIASRRAVPAILLPVVTLLTVAAAIVGVRAEPSSNRLALQAAFHKTSEADYCPQ